MSEKFIFNFFSSNKSFISILLGIDLSSFEKLLQSYLFLLLLFLENILLKKLNFVSPLFRDVIFFLGKS